MIQDGMVRIISRESAWERMSVRVLDINTSPTKTETETLVETIVNLVDPDSGESNGGYGRVSMYEDKLVFAQTEETTARLWIC